MSTFRHTRRITLASPARRPPKTRFGGSSIAIRAVWSRRCAQCSQRIARGDRGEGRRHFTLYTHLMYTPDADTNAQIHTHSQSIKTCFFDTKKHDYNWWTCCCATRLERQPTCKHVIVFGCLSLNHSAEGGREIEVWSKMYLQKITERSQNKIIVVYFRLELCSN